MSDLTRWVTRLGNVAITVIATLSVTIANAQSMPDPSLTPGAVRTTDVREICTHGTRELRHWSRSRDEHIMVEYGLPAGGHPDYEVDHLVPLGIGGADDDNNLWAEPRCSIEQVYNAERKDDLEFTLRDLVCTGQLDVQTAQHAIADDWTEAYRNYVGGRGAAQ